MSQGGEVQWIRMYHLLPWQKPKQWGAVESFANMMFCCLFLLLQGHHKDKNNPPWQICFQKVSLSFSIIAEKYCPIVLTPIECFDRALMNYPVFPVIQMHPPLVFEEERGSVKCPSGIPTEQSFLISRHVSRYVRFLIGRNLACKHLSAEGNCANANSAQPTGRREQFINAALHCRQRFACSGQDSKLDENFLLWCVKLWMIVVNM